jgi:NAD-dependent deacetylase
MDLVKLSVSLEEAVALIQNARFVIALTGAGSSTPSGIPDFRSSGSGLWTKYSPTEVASLSAFRRRPERFFKWLRPLVRHMLSASPNPFHIALAQLEKSKHLKTTITQNIDGLHQRAGTSNVLEVHGSLDTLTCIGCYKKANARDYLDPYLDAGEIPHCPSCGNYLKPDIVLFEEQLPSQTWLKARQTTDACDLMIVAGTSLVVSPVAQLPERAKNNGAQIIIVNKSATYMDSQADVVIHGDVAEIFPIITAKILNE